MYYSVACKCMHLICSSTLPAYPVEVVAGHNMNWLQWEYLQARLKSRWRCVRRFSVKPKNRSTRSAPGDARAAQLSSATRRRFMMASVYTPIESDEVRALMKRLVSGSLSTL